jgi:hypothetical protein
MEAATSLPLEISPGDMAETSSISSRGANESPDYIHHPKNNVLLKTTLSRFIIRVYRQMK